MKILCVCSQGGHLYQLLKIKNELSHYDSVWVTADTADVRTYLKNVKKYVAHFPDSRNVINLVKNFFLAPVILLKEKPTVIMSSGSAVAVPFMYWGKLFGAKIIFVELYDFVAYPTLTGRLIAPIADLLLIQHTIQKRWFKNGVFVGSLL